MIQIGRLVFSEPKRAHVTPLFVSLHWLPVAAHIKFKTLMLAYRTATGSAPSYFQSLMTIYIPSRSLRSASEWRLVVPSQRGTKSLSRTFSFPVPGWFLHFLWLLPLIMYRYVLLNCKSLWIKASAKWINVNHGCRVLRAKEEWDLPAYYQNSV